jgi:hypothetical protein
MLIRTVIAMGLTASSPVTPDVLKKLPAVGEDLDQFSLETVQMFYNDARTAGFTLETSRAGSAK